MVRIADEGEEGNGDGVVDFGEFCYIIIKIVNAGTPERVRQRSSFSEMAATNTDKLQGRLKGRVGGKAAPKSSSTGGGGTSPRSTTRRSSTSQSAFITAGMKEAAAATEAENSSKGMEEWSKWIGKIGVRSYVLDCLPEHACAFMHICMSSTLTRLPTLEPSPWRGERPPTGSIDGTLILDALPPRCLASIGRGVLAVT